MKKFVSVLLSLSILFSLSACAPSGGQGSDGPIVGDPYFNDPEDYTYDAWFDALQKRYEDSETAKDRNIIKITPKNEKYQLCKVVDSNYYIFHTTSCGSAEFEREYTYEEMVENIAEEFPEGKYFYYDCELYNDPRNLYIAVLKTPSLIRYAKTWSPSSLVDNSFCYRHATVEGIPVLLGKNDERDRYALAVCMGDFAVRVTADSPETAKEHLRTLFEEFHIESISLGDIVEKGHDAVGRVIKPSDAIAPAVPVWAFVILAAIALLVIGAGVFVIVLFVKHRKKSTLTK